MIITEKNSHHTHRHTHTHTHTHTAESQLTINSAAVVLNSTCSTQASWFFFLITIWNFMPSVCVSLYRMASSRKFQKREKISVALTNTKQKRTQNSYKASRRKSKKYGHLSSVCYLHLSCIWKGSSDMEEQRVISEWRSKTVRERLRRRVRERGRRRGDMP